MTRRFLALVILAALLGGGLSHASIEHTHGHAHDDGETSIWMTLHAGLRHEDKKLLFMAVASVALAVLALVAIQSGLAHRFAHISAIAARRDPYARDALRRGIYRYRVFG